MDESVRQPRLGVSVFSKTPHDDFPNWKHTEVNISHREADNCHILILTLISLSAREVWKNVMHASRFIFAPPLLSRARALGKMYELEEKRFG